jgi:hypothetical protein
MKIFYVSIERSYYDIEVEARDEDSAIEKALQIINGNPTSFDDEVTNVEELGD